MRAIFITLILSLLTCAVFSQGSFKPDPKVDVIHYEFNIAINDSNDVISGRTIITLRLSALSSAVSFDLKNIAPSGKGMSVTSVTLNRQAARWSHQNNRLTVQTEGVVKASEEALIEIVYSGIPADGLIISKNKFGDRTFFSDNWPDRASNYIPTANHPSDKATVDFIVTAPSHYKVVGSGYMVEESDLGKGVRLTHWKEDVPLPVKVMAFGAAEFATKLAGIVKGIPVWTWVYRENRLEGFNDYAMALRPLAFYDSLIGPYPYEKLANVQSKTIFGGLENAGCIFYSENSVTGQGRAESLLAHEISHQWFGNSVTEASWHHIWLSEGFATYLTTVYMEKTYGKERLAERMKSDRDRVIRYYDRTPAPVIDTTITDLMKLLSANSYQKGGWVLHMLRQEVGDDSFFRGLRIFYSRFRNKNALTNYFRKVMEEVSGRNLEKFFYQWLNVAGQPELKITTQVGRRKGTIDIIIEQTQEYLFTFNLDLSITDSGGTRLRSVIVNSKTTTINVPGDTNTIITPDPGVKLLFRVK